MFCQIPAQSRFFTVLAKKLGPEAFVKHKSGRALGGLAPAYYDAVTMGLLPLIDRLGTVTPDRAKKILNDAVGHENENFRDNVGPGANAVPRLYKRIAEVKRVFDQQLRPLQSFPVTKKTSNGPLRGRR